MKKQNVSIAFDDGMLLSIDLSSEGIRELKLAIARIHLADGKTQARTR